MAKLLNHWKATEMFTNKIGNDFYLAVFNYSDKPRVFPIDLKRFGLQPGKKYTIKEILSGDKYVSGINVDAASAVLYKFN
jgi:alpha-galactosidase